MSTWIDDLRFAWRMLLKTRGTTAAALVAFALGLGGNMAMYSVADVLLFRPLLLPELDRLVVLPAVVNGQATDIDDISPADFRDLRDQTRTLVHPAAIEWWTTNVTGVGEPMQVRAFRVSADFFTTLMASPAYGRVFRPGEDVPGRDAVAVLSHGLWKERFGGDPHVVGRVMRLDDRPFEIVGVMPEDVRYPAPAEIWVPLAMSPKDWQSRGEFYLTTIGRLAPGVSLAEAASEIETLTRRIAADHPSTHANRFDTVRRARDWVSGGPTRSFNLMLLGVVGFVLVIACANVANLQFARVSARHREFAVRTAMGAKRWRLVRQLLVEGILLAVLGAAASVLLAVWVTDLIKTSMPAEVKIYLPGWDRMRVNGHAIAYTALLAGTSGIVAGLAAAFAGLRGDVTVALKEGGRSAVGSARHRLRSALVLCQVVLALVLLVGAGLMAKGFGGLTDPIPNAAPERVLTMHVELPETKYPDRVRRVAFVQRALSELSALRGAESVAIGSTLPYSGYGSGSDFEIEGRPSLSPAERPHTRTLSVSERYLSTLRVPFVRGRDFRASDDEKGQAVAIVSEAIVRRYFPNEDPIGRRIQIGSGADVPWTTIVGVVRDVLYDWVTPSSALMIYRPYTQVSRASVSVAIRTAGDPLRLASAARAAIRGVDPDQPVSEVMTFRKLLDDYLIGLAYVAWMMGVFGFVALTLSVIGLYSMLTYDVAERTREIGVRMALGARRMDVLRLVLVRGLALTGVGLALGLVASLWVTRSLASLFYGVQAYDAVAIGGVMLLLAATASIACLVPAHRATQVDPLQSLRNE